MPELPDHELLADFAKSGCESSFAALVGRYVNLVYSTALRFTGNPHHAEEITQAVFILLARKAGNLSPRTVLSGWLYQSARLTAANFKKSELRRQRREQEAYMQSTLNESDPAAWEKIAPFLDDAMGCLGETDRDAVVLRFFENKTAAEVATTLKLTEAAAHKRVSRALEKLRKFFTRRGVISTTTLIAGAISVNSVQAAPVALVQSVTAAAIAKGAAAGGSGLVVATATLIAMKTKTIIATVSAGALILGIGSYLFYQSKAASAGSSDTIPIKLANDTFIGPTFDGFLCQLDPDTRRTADSAPALHIKSLTEPTSAGSADYVKALTNIVARGPSAARYAKYSVDKNSSLFGKRIRVTGWVKSSDIRNWAGTTLAVMNDEGRVFATDSMFDRPVHGTADWRQIEFVTDVPKEPCIVALVPTLYGPGEFWCDDFQIEVVSTDTPITDDRRWTVWCQCPSDFSETFDEKVTHNGQPALCITYVSPEPPQKYSFVWWGQHNRYRETFKQYLGHTVRMSVWAKSENITARAGLDFQPKDAHGKQLVKATGATQIKGTTDWTQYSITCVIPKETEDFQTAVFMYGRGKLWVDTNSFKFEIVK